MTAVIQGQLPNNAPLEQSSGAFPFLTQPSFSALQ
jgi:hypothetical protein